MDLEVENKLPHNFKSDSDGRLILIWASTFVWDGICLLIFVKDRGNMLRMLAFLAATVWVGHSSRILQWSSYCNINSCGLNKAPESFRVWSCIWTDNVPYVCVICFLHANLDSFFKRWYLWMSLSFLVCLIFQRLRFFVGWPSSRFH